MAAYPPEHFAVHCPSRELFDQIADKWSMMVLTVLEAGPMRFNALKRHLEGVTQKALTHCVRRLERNGLVSRRVIPVSPIAVEYEITPLGRSLQAPFQALHAWMLAHLAEVDAARRQFDQAHAPAAATSKGLTQLLEEPAMLALASRPGAAAPERPSLRTSNIPAPKDA